MKVTLLYCDRCKCQIHEAPKMLSFLKIFLPEANVITYYQMWSNRERILCLKCHKSFSQWWRIK